ncbi:MAG TPA: hypothetical protein VHN20_05390 [Beijerinckiaceae bacterium]|nr:hypothetical protein [Beijerinckiaceae bacterium]
MSIIPATSIPADIPEDWLEDGCEIIQPSAPVFDGDWMLLSRDAQTGRTVWILETDTAYVVKTEYPACDELLDHNTVIRNETSGQRWGDTRLVASIPEHIYFREIAPARQQGDETYIKRWLNNSDHAAFRTFHGKV